MVKINVTELFTGIDAKIVGKILLSKELMSSLSDIIKLLSCSDTLMFPISELFGFMKHAQYNNIKLVLLYDYNTECKLSKNTVQYVEQSYYNKQGIIIINLYTHIIQSTAYKTVWSQYIDKLVTILSKKNDVSPPIFLLNGETVISKKKHLINDKCNILEYPYSDNKHLCELLNNTGIKYDNFKNINMLLEKKKYKSINWEPVPHLIYTDGACTGNGKGIAAYAGYAVYFSEGALNNKVKYKKLEPVIINNEIIYPTNQRAEGIAICVALESANYTNVTIVTDSKFWINMIEDYIPSWILKGIDFNTKKNPDITNRLKKIIDKKFNIKLIHIESHGKNPNSNPEHVKGNDIADKFAVKAKHLTHHNEITEKIN
jgi:ribonuclease HI/uracil DNA glycosylase